MLLIFGMKIERDDLPEFSHKPEGGLVLLVIVGLLPLRVISLPAHHPEKIYIQLCGGRKCARQQPENARNIVHWEWRNPLFIFLPTSVADPDPYVIGPSGSGSGSVSQRYGYGSGSFYHQAKIVSKTFIPTVFWLHFDFLSLRNDVNVPSKINIQKKLVFSWHLEGPWRK